MKPCMLAFISFLLILICRAEAYSGAALLFGGRKAGPRGSVGEEPKRYAVVFDAGSTGSRVHVFCFDRNLDLVNIGDDIELFVKVKPGLSAYADDPQAAADSLIPLLVEAKKVVPEELQPKTPVRLGATAGLRNLGEDTSNKILEAVRNLLQESSLEYKPEWITILAGSQEGSYLWVAMNYLLGNLGKNYASTVGVLDLGGGSVQMAYAISEEASTNAPMDSDDPYVQPKLLNGTTYNLYTHSYLNYGLMAARAEILKVSNGIYSYCILSGYAGSYEYGDEVFNASASPFGSSYPNCRSDALRALKIDAACAYIDCTFGGIWSGGGGVGQQNVYVASYFFDRASEAGFVDPDAPAAKVSPTDFKHAAKRACSLTLEDAKATYPAVSENDLPYFCMDLVYQYTLLVDGFGLNPRQEITLVSKVKYAGSYVEAAWPLGSAIEVVSGNIAFASLKSTLATATKDLLCFWLRDHRFCSSGVNGL